MQATRKSLAAVGAIYNEVIAAVGCAGWGNFVFNNRLGRGVSVLFLALTTLATNQRAEKQYCNYYRRAWTNRR